MSKLQYRILCGVGLLLVPPALYHGACWWLPFAFGAPEGFGQFIGAIFAIFSFGAFAVATVFGLLGVEMTDALLDPDLGKPPERSQPPAPDELLEWPRTEPHDRTKHP